MGNRMKFMLRPDKTPAALAGKLVDIYDFPDGRLEIRWKGLHPPECPGFCVKRQVENPRAKVGFSRIMAVLEIADFWHNWSGEGIFLQSFVLRRFSTV
jgi:hypothetical protein